MEDEAASMAVLAHVREGCSRERRYLLQLSTSPRHHNGPATAVRVRAAPPSTQAGPDQCDDYRILSEGGATAAAGPNDEVGVVVIAPLLEGTGEEMRRAAKMRRELGSAEAMMRADDAVQPDDRRLDVTGFDRYDKLARLTHLEGGRLVTTYAFVVGEELLKGVRNATVCEQRYREKQMRMRRVLFDAWRKWAAERSSARDQGARDMCRRRSHTLGSSALLQWHTWTQSRRLTRHRLRQWEETLAATRLHEGLVRWHHYAMLRRAARRVSEAVVMSVRGQRLRDAIHKWAQWTVHRRGTMDTRGEPGEVEGARVVAGQVTEEPRQDRQLERSEGPVIRTGAFVAERPDIGMGRKVERPIEDHRSSIQSTPGPDGSSTQTEADRHKRAGLGAGAAISAPTAPRVELDDAPLPGGEGEGEGDDTPPSPPLRALTDVQAYLRLHLDAFTASNRSPPSPIPEGETAEQPMQTQMRAKGRGAGGELYTSSRAETVYTTPRNGPIEPNSPRQQQHQQQQQQQPTRARRKSPSFVSLEEQGELEPSGERRLWGADRSPGPLVVSMEAEEGDKANGAKVVWEEEGGRRGFVSGRGSAVSALQMPGRMPPPTISQQPTPEGQPHYERDPQPPPYVPFPATAPFGLQPAASVQTYRAPGEGRQEAEVVNGAAAAAKGTTRRKRDKAARQEGQTRAAAAARQEAQKARVVRNKLREELAAWEAAQGRGGATDQRPPPPSAPPQPQAAPPPPPPAPQPPLCAPHPPVTLYQQLPFPPPPPYIAFPHIMPAPIMPAHMMPPHHQRQPWVALPKRESDEFARQGGYAGWVGRLFSCCRLGWEGGDLEAVPAAAAAAAAAAVPLEETKIERPATEEAPQEGAATKAEGVKNATHEGEGGVELPTEEQSEMQVHGVIEQALEELVEPTKHEEEAAREAAIARKATTATGGQGGARMRDRADGDRQAVMVGVL
ncbi:unnamed protein product [Vitrella brassicaformis CCMP3155]|uniref:Uncharacterized protein n=1 Tax=Vitrella brassicaformis (strain CCMP3155) TaxID=1169540 RepID=A0A0G4FVI2_VITBC|nr:unnamed protein product [Vitrella brassicaformis CCMP3155]|eukprot:CEM18717.1 unnamed protein product [Vitrella brassicaformis CCMP3155]